MKTADIQNALLAQLASGNVATGGSWPNVNSTVQRPYFEATITPVERVSDIKGRSIKEIGVLGVVIVVEGDTGSTAANQFADTVANGLFAPGTKLTFPDGKVAVTAPPVIQGGYRDGPDWRVPVVIRYRASKE